MQSKNWCLTAFLLLWVNGVVTFGQSQQEPAKEDSVPVYRINVVARTVPAITYRVNSGSTKVDLKGTALMPYAKGKAEVENKQGIVSVKAEMEKLDPPSNQGPEFLTYVLWAITPEGHPSNLGEVIRDGDKGKMEVTTRLGTFGLLVTVEPYFSVSIPSDVVVLETVVRKDTQGKVVGVDAKFELLQRGQYAKAGLQAVSMDPKVPLDLYQARNALHVAKWEQADKYAADTYQKAEKTLQQAEDYQNRKGNNRKPVIMTAREAAQTAETSRVLAVKRIQQEKVEMDKAAGAEREAEAKRQQEEEAKARVLAEEQQRKAELDRKEAELKAAQETAAKEKAEAGRLAAKLEEEKARQQAAEAEADAKRAEEERRKAEAEKDAMRANLLAQFNRILPTRDTNRGLVVNMGDVLFDTGKYTLRPEAREALAKLSGIVLAHPGLNLEIEGHTDSTGSDEFNQKLSEQRADSVRMYLAEQQISPQSLTARGYGKTMPVASNETAKGRQQNRRVEIIVSGEVIGTKIGTVVAQ
jgi:outer membrane protein OmpA-like peptidoglycan-associated protein